MGCKVMAKLQRWLCSCSLLVALCIRPAFTQSGLAPSVAEAALPEPVAFLKSVTINSDQYARLRQDYLCQTEVVIRPKKSSRSQTTVTEEYESFYINGKEIDRVVKVNDVPLSERAIAQQDARLKKETDAALSSNGSRGKPPGPTLEEMVLAKSIFSDERRIWKDGRSFIAFKFRGDHHIVPQTPTEAIARFLKGDVSIDEADHAIVEIKGVTQGDVVYSGRFLMPDKFEALVFQAKRINDEIYVPSLVRIAVADDQADEALAAEFWNRSLELRTYSVSSCRKFRVSATIIPTEADSH
jgi:hypothetical protein